MRGHAHIKGPWHQSLLTITRNHRMLYDHCQRGQWVMILILSFIIPHRFFCSRLLALYMDRHPIPSCSPPAPFQLLPGAAKHVLALLLRSLIESKQLLSFWPPWHKGRVLRGLEMACKWTQKSAIKQSDHRRTNLKSRYLFVSDDDREVIMWLILWLFFHNLRLASKNGDSFCF